MKTLLFAASLLPATPLLAQDFVCPASSQTASAEWQQFQPSTSAAQPTSIELYQGDPRQGAALIADDSSQKIGVAPLAWTLDGQPHLHMACIYGKNQPRLVRPLPAGLSYCLANNEFEDQHLQLECR